MYFKFVSILIGSLLLLSIGCSSQDDISQQLPFNDVENPHYKTYREALKSIQDNWTSANARISQVYSAAISQLPKTNAEGYNPKQFDALKTERRKLLKANNTKRNIARDKAWHAYKDAMLTDDEKQLLSKTMEKTNVK